MDEGNEAFQRGREYQKKLDKPIVEALKHSSQVILAYNTMLAMRATDEDIVAMLDSEFDILGLQIEQVLAQIGGGI